VLALQRAAGNRAVTRLLAGRTPVVQRVKHVPLSPEAYGEPPSDEAYNVRTTANPALAPELNIATFRLAPRPALGGRPGSVTGSFTRPSTGTGIYQTHEGRYKDTEFRTNQSHSEHQIIDADLKPLLEAQQFPRNFVIDSVYTERPACPDVWVGSTRMSKGCSTEIADLEKHQKLRQFDVDNGGSAPFALRDDLEITVYSSFASDAPVQIPLAVFMRKSARPVREQYVSELAARIERAYQSQYSAGPKGEYDTVQYDAFPADARRAAEEDVPAWDDYTFPRTKAGLVRFAQELATYLREESKYRTV
jgi:hypothetical protein